MTFTNEIVEEVRAVREAYAVWFNYDLARIYADLKAKEQVRGNISALRPTDPKPKAKSSK